MLARTARLARPATLAMTLLGWSACASQAASGARSGESAPTPDASTTERGPLASGCDAPTTEAERKRFADEVAARSVRLANVARARLSDARKRGAAVECHDDKLSRANVTARAVEASRRALIEALAASDPHGAERRAIELAYLCVRAATIAEESAACR